MGRAKFDGPGPAAAHPLKKLTRRAYEHLVAGPGRGPSNKKMMGPAGPRPNIKKKLDGPGRAAAHYMKK